MTCSTGWSMPRDTRRDSGSRPGAPGPKRRPGSVHASTSAAKLVATWHAPASASRETVRNRLLGQNLLEEVGGGFRHASRTTAWTEAAALATASSASTIGAAQAMSSHRPSAGRWRRVRSPPMWAARRSSTGGSISCVRMASPRMQRSTTFTMRFRTASDGIGLICESFALPDGAGGYWLDHRRLDPGRLRPRRGEAQIRPVAGDEMCRFAGSGRRWRSRACPRAGPGIGRLRGYARFAGRCPYCGGVLCKSKIQLQIIMMV